MLAAQDKTQKTLDFQKWTFKNYFMSKRTVFIHWWLQFCFQRGTFLEKFNKIFVNIFFGKSCNDYQNVQYFPASKEKNFETEISAHVGCAIGTPNFLDLVGINPATSSLNRIFVTFFLEKKSGGENNFPSPPRAEKREFFGFCLVLAFHKKLDFSEVFWANH